MLFVVKAEPDKLKKPRSARADAVAPSKLTMSRREFLVGGIRRSLKPSEAIAVPVPSAEATGLTDMKVAESCTLCNACVEACPHGALAIQVNELIFQPEKCTGCGDCVQICPEHAIALSEIDESITLHARTVYKDEMVRCAKCNTPYASVKMLRKVSEMLHGEAVPKLCPNCRQKQIYEKLFLHTQ
jgi:ferredoxin